MRPRKGAATGKATAPGGAASKQRPTKQRGSKGNGLARRSNESAITVGENNEDEAPPALPHTAAANGKTRLSVRPVMTPLGGRKYARGNVDVAVTPKRADVMRVAVSRTPYTASRGISGYEAEKDPIRTYIRLKPGDIGRSPCAPLLHVVSDKEVEVSRGDARERYLFTGVVPSLAQQARVFEVCAAPVVRDVAMGFNTLLFSFGVSNSGKTYTVQGTPGAPGMLPRSVKALLDVLDDRDQQGDFAVRPRYATQVEYCSDPRIVAPTFRVAPGEDAWVAGLDGDCAAIESAQMAEIAQALDSDGGRGAWVYQVYVSYIEVYNEMVYDLLDLTTLTTVHVGDAAQRRPPRVRPRGGGGNKRSTLASFNDDPTDPLLMCPAQIAALPRTALIVRAAGGRRGEAFVDGATEVRVRTTRDLVRVLAHGQMRRAVHATGLNAGSSRSHALFQVKLVKLRRDARVVALAPLPAEARASVRTMTIVDLAGSERAKRTLNHGDRLAEAGKINVGLMTLKKCLDVRRFNATATADAAQLVPYNESKVTRLFQPALEGGAKTVMVVCVDPYEHPDVDAAHALAETKSVLDFARVASELVTCVAKVEDPEAPEPPSSRLSMFEDDDDDEDEVFFDSAGRRSTTTRKRSGSTVIDARVSIGSSDDDDVFDVPRPPLPDAAKRQRNDLGGAWQHPKPSTAAATAAPSQPAMRMPPVPPRHAARPHPQSSGVAPPSSPFSFEMPAAGRSVRDTPVALTRTLQRQQQKQQQQGGGGGGSDALRSALDDANARIEQLTRAKDAETDELATYAEHLEAALADLRKRYVAVQERLLCIEHETRAEVSAFFMATIKQLQAGAADRLHDEISRGEAKAAHKIDILSRLRSLHADNSDASDAEDREQDPADSTHHVSTVSPRTATRRAMSRKASRKANKFTSISAGENAEIANLRLVVESLEAQMSSQRTQLDMTLQARSADRATREALEAALIEANGRTAALEARLLKAMHLPAADHAIMQAHDRERAESAAQIAMLRSQLHDAETQAMRARRRWETQELLPLQERVRILVEEEKKQPDDAMQVDDRVDRAIKQKDDALKWWMKEQARVSQVNAQNDVLMREIRQLRARLRTDHSGSVAAEPQPHQQGSPRHSIHTESTSDGEDGSFCKISLRSVDSFEALNGGNPIGVSALGLPGAAQSVTSQNSLASPIRALDRVVSKGRVLHRNVQPHGFSQESVDSMANGRHGGGGGGRAKRVVSRVFNRFANDSRRTDPSRPPYMAGRFAHTDSAIGNFSTQVLSFTDGSDVPMRSRGNTVDSVDSAADPVMQPRVRSTVYSGPIVSHASGGVSVTFTSEEIHDMPIDAAAANGQEENEDDAAVSTKRSRSMVRKPGQHMQGLSAHEPPIAEEDEEDEARASIVPNSSSSVPDRSSPTPPPLLASAMSSSLGHDKDPAALAADAQATIKKKRKLHAGRTVLSVGSPDSDSDNRLVGAPVDRRAATPLLAQPSLTALSKAAAPQESKQPVLFTPVRVRANSKTFDEDGHEHMVVPPPGSNKLLDDNAVDSHGESIFLTPMKMLSRLRNRKK